MKYYKFKVSLSNDDGRISSSASVDKTPNIENLFEKIRYGEVVENFPVIDSFYLESYDDKKYWENQKNDIHTLIGKVNILIGWYISEDLKSLLENFKIAPKYNFYETILMYKGDKFKYWIFQFPIDQFKIIDFQKSKFSLDGEDTLYHFSSEEDYLTFYRKEYRLTKRKLKIVQQVLKASYDLFATTSNDKVMSEKLKNRIEEMGLTGFEFLELDYKIVIDDK